MAHDEKSQARKAAEATTRLPIGMLVPDPQNPRELSDVARQGLGVSLETFGPLDMVYNETTGQIVSGHQRIENLKAAGATEIVRVDQDWGHIVHPGTGEKFMLRFVRWDETKQRMANLVANSPELQGEFTAAALDQVRSLEEQEKFEALALDDLEKNLADEFEGAEKAERERQDLEDFELATAPKKAWILIATSSDRVPEIEDAVRRFEGPDTRIEVSGGKG
jgi:hypothetical protein